ncbi:PREDICTED: uncharacterized protein LOC105567745 isoform X2 [Vollenhovia emeryi]|uniref:uncharacterized protein LOC105567745 isoform X2 n=1 Tax=Vollenhovia emeryi TaxID=411798 RepID=UPI0005F4BD94|nr:PREDICTED: uncharacterized protein LOC105567745 isoform X2 [Vollenhovia emeryi]XP_011878246.1 PREDICTED: uncharacterized protein LOC105567745 isoform X2 [Vollenhovia emeryi]
MELWKTLVIMVTAIALYFFLSCLPKKEDLKMKWYANIGRKVGRWSAVCSQHFQEEDFRYKIIGGAVRRFLVPTAIPSLLLNKSDDVQVKTERTIEDDVSQATPNIVNDTALLNNSSEISFVDCKEYQNINSIVSDEGSKAPTLERQYYVQVKAEQTNEDNVSQATPDLNIFNDTALLDDSSEISFEDCKEYQNINNIGSDEGSKAPINIERVVQQPLTDAERWCNARYIGDLQRIDFTSDKSWIIVQDFLKNMRRKQRTSNQKIHRLNRKVKSLKALLNHFKQNSKLSNKAGTSLEIGN